jgi:hypothetical protein
VTFAWGIVEITAAGTVQEFHLLPSRNPQGISHHKIGGKNTTFSISNREKEELFLFQIEKIRCLSHSEWEKDWNLCLFGENSQ